VRPSFASFFRIDLDLTLFVDDERVKVVLPSSFDSTRKSTRSPSEKAVESFRWRLRSIGDAIAAVARAVDGFAKEISSGELHSARISLVNSLLSRA